ncbi:ATP-grasp domain-containing protein [Qipengyuania flava]|uniref:ATP-grasp domain-containing protein n=1 Tax=Qipengyuania flava TaxID=192812 RepID=UPI001C638315|nr:ATP-grasp domain-containing protein [Qipengyuania flava]QYJ08379.1 ATP-grasp domain-containing protein [Qipengyuania flava]
MAWVERIKALIEQHGFSLLVPTSDASIAQLAAHRADLGEHRVAAPSDATLEILVDKGATREAARKLGVPTASGRLSSAPHDADQLAHELGLPLIVKSPRSYSLGEASQKTGVALVESREEIADALSGRETALVEGFLPGFCRGVSVLAKDGEVLQAFQHKRLRQEHATGPSSWRVSEDLDPALLEASRRIVAHSGLTGVAMFEYRCNDETGEFALLEVNPRFWGSMQLAADAGADYPALLHDMLIEGQVPGKRFDFPSGLQKRSVWGEFDALSQAFETAGGGLERIAFMRRLTQFLGALAKREGFDSYAKDDPEPFERERAQVLGRFRSRITNNAPIGGRTTSRDR